MKDKVERVRPETKRGAIKAGLMWWTDKHYLDAEMRRRLTLKDRPKGGENGQAD